MSSNLVKSLPAIALRGTTILPDMIVHFDVSRKTSVKAVEIAMLEEQKVFLVTQKDPDVEHPGLVDVYKIGTIATVKQMIKMPKGIIRILVEGVERAELLSFDPIEDYLSAEVSTFDDVQTFRFTDNEQEARLRTLRELLTAYSGNNQNISGELVGQLLEIDNTRELVDQLSINLPLSYEQRQKILEAVDIGERYELLGIILSNEIEIGEIRVDIQNKIKEKIDKNQRDYILREQLKVIKEELGEDNVQSDIVRFRDALKKLKASSETKKRIDEEINRFENIAGSPSEGAVARGYIETLLQLPWNKASKDNRDLKDARTILEEDHYGLEKVKERILEFLAVRALTKKGDSPILCLVGPPGTGKTSIGRSVARALSKKYVRISLGGVRDEAEIRGHRRTYVGALPGRIASGLASAGVKNPLFVLDEIDKVSSDYKGDTASALLEVLDSEQNSKFADHYVEIPIDLSEVLFIATANDRNAIPRPLLDRMEIIEISSYTENEKMHIAKEHLIPKQIKANGIPDNCLTIEDDALFEIISGYTKEAGVRTLERFISRICRKTARKILEEHDEKVVFSTDNIEDFLGKPKFNFKKANETPQVGIVRGLAWTSVGGDTLQIEVNILPGKGDFLLTGQLGDVMKESARTGISYIRSIADLFHIDKGFFKENDIHIHIPEGAVPKDGPSAGITMATAMVSAILGLPVRADIAMTGEITLRGRVLPIGGLKEKLLAAKKAGMKTVLVPFENKPDVEELESEITEGLDILPVSTMDEVLKRAIVGGEFWN